MKKNYLFSLVLFFIALTAPNVALTQPVNHSLFEAGLQYRCIGPARGGRVTAVTGIPSRPFTFFMGATGGGVWRTDDAGLNWHNISDGYLAAASIGAIAVAPSDPNVLYIGTGAADVRGNVSAGKGMYKSLNGGKTWTAAGLENAGQIAGIVIHPADPDWVYAAVLGNIFGPNPDRGVFRSRDGGRSWKKVHFVNDRTGAVDLVMDPSNPRILYAGMWTAERKPWTFIDGSADGGVWKSTDSGDTWKKLENGLPTGKVGRIGIAVSPADPQRVWVQIEAQEETLGGLYRSDDGAATFHRVNRSHELRQRAWYYSRVYADPKDRNTVYALNVRFWKSIDGGANFEPVRTPHSDNHALWINPDNPLIMVEGNDGGANVSLNGGKTWSSILNQPTAEFYRVTADNSFPYRVYAAQQDNTTISVPSRWEADISPLQHWYSAGGGESGHIAVDPRNPDLLYAGNYIGQITRKDRKAGHQKDIVAYPQMHDGLAPRDIRYRFQWNAPIRISPHRPDVVYHCSQFVHRSADNGKTWEVISPDLTTNNDRYLDLPGGPIQHDHTGVELFCTIFAFEESPHQAGELWAGSDDGLVHLTKDEGRTWVNITPKTMPANATVNMIELSAHQPGRALIAAHKYRENDFRPYIFLTDDYGQNWKLITAGIPAGHFVRVVREDPLRKGLLYAGTEYGMYLSFDEGRQWQPFQLNLPLTPIADMMVKNGDLVVATQGRSIWILDDLSPLRHIEEQESTAAGWLYAPRPAHRNQFGNYAHDPAAPDPAPNGALLYFRLPAAPDSTQPLRISILDASGKARRVFSAQPDKDKGEENLPTAAAGLNRLEWDLRYEKPKVLEKAVFSLADVSGLKALPGLHQVVLEIGNKRWDQPLVLQKDPRWTQSDTDLRAQYELAMRVKSLLESCHQSVEKLRAARTQIQDVFNRKSAAKLPVSTQAQKEMILKKLNELEEDLIQHRSESGQDPINYPSKIDDQIAYLYSIVNHQDDRPNAGAYERLSDLEKELAPLTERLNAILEQDVAALNAALLQQGVRVVGER
jgi:photosystem II stability/assembly factor-like uncharacterized protein